MQPKAKGGLRFAKRAHQCLRIVEQRALERDRHGRTRAQEINVGFIRKAASDPLERHGVEAQLRRVEIGAVSRIAGFDFVRFVIREHEFAAFFKPQIDLSAQHDVLYGHQKIGFPFDA